MKNMQLARQIPSVNDVLLRSDVTTLLSQYPRSLVLQSARDVISTLRSDVSRHSEETLKNEIDNLASTIGLNIQNNCRFSLRPVINASGVILHTNLGRAPLGANAIHHIVEVAIGYSNLELDLVTGTRSRRDDHAESMFLRLLRLKAVNVQNRRCLVVNNCAAATFLVLNSIAAGGEVIVSRGELVEIGGGFRIPEILLKSGAILKEVGTTNRTRLSDYQQAITPQTRLILRVHQSNFRIEGFTHRPHLQELVQLSKKSGAPLFDDQGTGCIASLENYGVSDESSLLESAASGADVVAASGDKLLGGPQCGLIFANADLIDQVRGNPLLRALRVDKLTYAALEATLIDYLAGNYDGIPIIRMLSVKAEELRARCETLLAAIHHAALTLTIVPTQSLIGGGTTPGAQLPGFAIALRHETHSADTLARLLRQSQPPVIARIKDEEVLLDLRTVPPEADAVLIRHLNSGFPN